MAPSFPVSLLLPGCWSGPLILRLSLLGGQGLGPGRGGILGVAQTCHTRREGRAGRSQTLAFMMPSRAQRRCDILLNLREPPPSHWLRSQSSAAPGGHGRSLRPQMPGFSEPLPTGQGGKGGDGGGSVGSARTAHSQQVACWGLPWPAWARRLSPQSPWLGPDGQVAGRGGGGRTSG